MKKRIILLGVAVVVFIGLYYVIHKRFATNTPVLSSALHAEKELSSDNLTEYLDQSPGKHVFYLDDGSADAQYVSTSILIPLSLEFDNALPLVEPVQFENHKLSVVGMKKTFKVDSLPAFVIIESSTDGTTHTVVATLSYDKEKPFDVKDLREWFHANNLWNAPFASN